MRDLIFDDVGEKGPFINKLGMKSYRFSREIALAQIIMNSLFFGVRPDQGVDFRRVRYEDIEKFLKLPENKTFDAGMKKNAADFKSALSKVEAAFGNDIGQLKRKSAIVSAYLFCERLLQNKNGKNLDAFPKFYIKLLDEMIEQAKLIKNYKTPTKKILLEDFQKNLQQASNESYSIRRRQIFLEQAFAYYLSKGEIIGDPSNKDKEV